MANWEWFTKFHRAVYHLTDGRLGANLAGTRMCLLTTVGRRSGQKRTIPLACFPDGDDLVIVGSNAGQEHDPAWWLNLQKAPQAEVQLGRERWRARASLATPDERARLWPWLKEQMAHYASYEQKTSREIPVVILRREASPARP